jgi:hypothetical protein
MQYTDLSLKLGGNQTFILSKDHLLMPYFEPGTDIDTGNPRRLSEE